MVKRAVRRSERPIGGSRGQLEAQLEDLGLKGLEGQALKEGRRNED